MTGGTPANLPSLLSTLTLKQGYVRASASMLQPS